MKLDCGETFAEFKARREQWHRWFAWYPVKLSDHDCRWLEFVERKGKFCTGYYDCFWAFEYRGIQ